MIQVNVNGAIAQFPDGTPRDVMDRALRERFAPKPQPATQEGVSITGEASKGLTRGILSTAGSVAGTIPLMATDFATYLANSTPAGFSTGPGMGAYQPPQASQQIPGPPQQNVAAPFFNRIISETQDAAAAKPLERDPRTVGSYLGMGDAPQAESVMGKFAGDLGEGIPSALAAVSAFLASGGSAAAAGITGGMLEAAGKYDEAKKRGLDDATALGEAAITGVGTGALNAIPFAEKLTKFLPRNLQGRVLGVVLRGAAEGSTETAEGGIDPVAKMLEKPPQSIDDIINVVRDMGKGIAKESTVFPSAAVLGAGMGVAPELQQAQKDMADKEVLDVLKELRKAKSETRKQKASATQSTTAQSRLQGNPIQPIIEQKAAQYGADPIEVSAIALIESNANPEIGASTAGALGVMQLMPDTAAELGVDPRDADQNIDGGVRYFQKMKEMFGGSPITAAIAYNWGPGNTKAWIENGADPAKLPAETRAYVRKFQRLTGGEKAPNLTPVARRPIRQAVSTQEPAVNQEMTTGETQDIGPTVQEIDDPIHNRRARTNLLVKKGAAFVPGLRLGDMEEAGRMAYLVEKGEITVQDWTQWVEQSRRENRFSDKSKPVLMPKAPDMPEAPQSAPTRVDEKPKLSRPTLRLTRDKKAGPGVAGQKEAAQIGGRIAVLKSMNDATGAYPGEDFNRLDPSQIDEVLDYMVNLQRSSPQQPPARQGVGETAQVPVASTPAKKPRGKNYAQTLSNIEKGAKGEKTTDTPESIVKQQTAKTPESVVGQGQTLQEAAAPILAQIREVDAEILRLARDKKLGGARGIVDLNDARRAVKSSRLREAKALAAKYDRLQSEIAKLEDQYSNQKPPAQEPPKASKKELQKAGERVKAHGLTQSQEDFLAKQIRDAWDSLPPTHKAAKEYNDRGEFSGLEIDVPGDGKFKIVSQVAANAIHKRITGKWIDEKGAKEAGRISKRESTPREIGVSPLAKPIYQFSEDSAATVREQGRAEQDFYREQDKQNRRAVQHNSNPQESYYAFSDGEFKKVKGSAVSILDGYEFFAWSLGSGNWNVTEASTGLRIGEGKSRADAINKARERVEKYGEQEIKKGISIGASKSGYTPRYLAQQDALKSPSQSARESADASPEMKGKVTPKKRGQDLGNPEAGAIVNPAEVFIEVAKLGGKFMRPQYEKVKPYLFKSYDAARKAGFKAIDWIADTVKKFGEVARPYARRAAAEYRRVYQAGKAAQQKKNLKWSKDAKEKALARAAQTIDTAISVKDFGKRSVHWMFNSSQDLPREVFMRDIERRNDIQAKAFNVKRKVKQLEREMDNHLDVFWGELDVLLKGFVWKDGELTAENKEYFKSLPEPIQNILVEMRQDVDAMTAEIKRLEIVDGALSEKMQRSLGKYLNRSYRIYERGANFKPSEEAKEKVRQLIRDEFEKHGQFASMFDAPTHEGVEQLEFFEPMKTLSEDDVEGILNSLLAVKGQDSLLGAIQNAKLGAKEVSILEARKDIPEAIRELWGEYKDPRANYANSVIKMASLIEGHKFQQEIREMGLGKFFFEKPTGEHAYPVAGPTSKSMDALTQGKPLYAKKEVAAAMNALNDIKSTGDIWRWYMTALSLVKVGLTVGNPASWPRNFIGAAMIYGGEAGLLNLDKSDYGRAIRIVLAGANLPKSVRKTDKADLDVFEEAIRYGVADQNVGVGMIQEDVTRASIDQFGEDWDEGIARSLVGLGKKAFSLPVWIYQNADNVNKIAQWIVEQKRVEAVHPEWSEQQVKKEAAGIVQNTAPTYSIAQNRAVKAIRNSPFFGPFPTFISEMVRTTKNTIELAWDEYNDTNPVRKQIGKERILGMMAVSSSVTVAGIASRILWGISKEDEDDLRKTLPTYSKNSTLIHFAPPEPGGKFNFVDTTFSDPWVIMRTPLMMILEGAAKGDVIDATVKAIGEISGDVLAAEPLTKTLVELATNKKSSGGEIWREGDSNKTIVSKMARHAGNTLMPGGAKSIRNIGYGVAGKKDDFGREYSAGEEIASVLTGQRLRTWDMSQSFGFKAREYKRRMANATRTFTEVANNRGNVTPEMLGNAIEEMETQRKSAFKDTVEIANSLLRQGVSRLAVKKILQDNGVSEDEAKRIIIGRYTAYRPQRENGRKYMTGARFNQSR